MTRSLVVVACMVLSLSLQGRVIKKQVAISYTEEVVNGVTFIHKLTQENGVKKEQFFVDGKAVETDEYEQTILEAEKEERRQERRKEQERQHKDLMFAHQARKEGNRRLLALYTSDIERELQRLAAYDLSPYFCFSLSTIGSEEQLVLIKKELIPEARSFLEGDGADYTTHELERIVTTLSSYPDRLHAFFNESVQQAIATCDDTKTLREFLALVS